MENILVFKFLRLQMLNSIINLFQIVLSCFPSFCFHLCKCFFFFSLQLCHIYMLLNFLFITYQLNFRICNSCFFLLLLYCQLVNFLSDSVVSKLNKKHLFFLVNKFSLRLDSLVSRKLDSRSTNLLCLKDEFFLCFVILKSTWRFNLCRRNICVSELLERHSSRCCLFVPYL